MLVLAGGRERNEAEWRVLLEGAGFEPVACRGRPDRGAMPLTVGTAGHIDHGKTWLVRALTGKDTDRLPEEQRRGISIDLGYAPLELPDGRRLSVIDVPGHERFVRTMVAGATGIDLFLLVIDAGEGARPQTHEHLAILRLLGIEHGVVALTKVDAVDADVVELAAEEARELVPGAEVLRVSARTGEGLDELRAALQRVTNVVEHARADGPTRMYVDRSFSVPGFGTVVTGTLWSGGIEPGDQLRLEPSGRDVRVRSVQVHDRDVDRAEPGQRVAVSLPGVERAEVVRGDVLVAPGAYPVSYRLDVVARGDRADRGRRASSGAHRNGTRSRAGRTDRRRASPSSASRRPWSRRAATASSSAARRRWAGARCSTPPAAGTATRADSSARARRHRRDDLRACAARLAALPRSTASSTGSSVRGRGSTRRHGSRSSRPSCARRSRSPTRSTRASPSPRSHGRGSRSALPFERRGSKLYLPGAVPTLGGRARGCDGAGGRAGRCRRADDEGRRRRARPLPRGERASRPAG